MSLQFCCMPGVPGDEPVAGVVPAAKVALSQTAVTAEDCALSRLEARVRALEECQRLKMGPLLERVECLACRVSQSTSVEQKLSVRMGSMCEDMCKMEKNHGCLCEKIAQLCACVQGLERDNAVLATKLATLVDLLHVTQAGGGDGAGGPVRSRAARKSVHAHGEHVPAVFTMGQHRQPVVLTKVGPGNKGRDDASSSDEEEEEGKRA